MILVELFLIVICNYYFDITNSYIFLIQKTIEKQ